MLDLALDVWLLALAASTGLFASVVVLQGVARAARSVLRTAPRPVSVLPVNRTSLDVDRRLAA